MQSKSGRPGSSSTRALNRRALIGAAAASWGIGALSIACRQGTSSSAGGSSAGKSSSDSGAAASIIGKEWNSSPGTPKYGGSLAYASVTPALGNLDPILSGAAMVHYVVSGAYSKLMRVGRKSDDQNAHVIYPDLATSWEIASPTTWTFHLRPGVKFHDVAPTNGRDLTAEDIKYSILRSATDKSSQWRGGFVNLDSVEIPDKQTVVLKLKRFDALLLSNLAGHYAWVVPQELVEGAGLKNAMVGSGPFIFQSWEQDSVVNFKKNPNYYLKGIPFVDELKMLQIASQEDRFAALRAGKIVDQTAVDIANYQNLKSSAGDLQFQKYAIVNPNCLFMNYKEPMFRDDRIRKAISLAISPDAIIKIDNAGEGLWRGVISNQNAGWTLSQDELKSKDYFLRQDVGEAKQLLSAAGYPNGFETEMIYNTDLRPNFLNEVQYVEQALAGIGVKVKLIGQEQTTLRKNQDTHNYKALLFGVDGQAYPEAFLLDYRSDGPKNGSGLDMKSLDDSIDKVLETADENERKTKAKDLTRQILKQVLWKVEYSDAFQYEVTPKWAKNYFAAAPQIYNTTGLAFTWIDKA
jgi:peptide/nickel transport system substrate-binding protein